jgi:deoxyadenosine/deoxycytidine kinase
MSTLIAVVGNVGVGKTTFTQRLCAATGFVAALEDHAARVFHGDVARGEQHATLANQIDFLLMRAEQEQTIRGGPAVGVQDGGLDQDFWGFTQLFARTGALGPFEFALCQRLYTMLRHALPPPDLFVHLVAPLPVLHARYTRRNRDTELTTADDIATLEQLIQAWLAQITHAPVITIDVTADDPSCAGPLAVLLPQIERALQT